MELLFQRFIGFLVVDRLLVEKAQFRNIVRNLGHSLVVMHQLFQLVLVHFLIWLVYECCGHIHFCLSLTVELAEELGDFIDLIKVSLGTKLFYESTVGTNILAIYMHLSDALLAQKPQAILIGAIMSQWLFLAIFGYVHIAYWDQTYINERLRRSVEIVGISWLSNLIKIWLVLHDNRCL